jgi:putative transposase
MDYKHEGHNVHLIVYHFVWCPKRRRTVLVGPVHDRLAQIIAEVADEHNWHIIRLAIQPDHVHLFIRANPYTAPTPTRCPRTFPGWSRDAARMTCARSLGT